MVILAEGRFSSLGSKTANAALLYLPDQVVAVIDSTKAPSTTQETVGIGGPIPIVSSLEESLQYQPNTVLIGIAPIGGQLPDDWHPIIAAALEHRLHIISGLHVFLSQDPEFKSLARKSHVEITDLRKIPSSHNIIAQGSWRGRTSKTILTVGTDSNIGKLTTAYQMYREMRRRDLNVAFVGTGQTGILISGRGIVVDSVIADFLAGAVEYEVDKAANEGFEYILVEGQGSITHCGFSGVTLGLMHGTMPDVMVMCHQPTRQTDSYGIPLPSLANAIMMHENLISVFRTSKVIGVGLNSIGMNKEELRLAKESIASELRLPAVDPLRENASTLVDALLEYYATHQRTPLASIQNQIHDRIH